MIASLLAPSSGSNDSQPARISQLLPTVKCSTCHKPVPLADLGDHTCTAPPPVPSLPKPSFTPEAATALLPDRLQGRVANGPPSSSGAPPPQGQAPAPAAIPSSSSASRLRINVNARGPPSPTQSAFLPRSSPLARADSSQSVRSASRSPQPPQPPYAPPMSASGSGSSSHSYSHSYASSSSTVSPLRTRPPASATIPNRMRTPSNAGSVSNQSTPSTARPGNSFLDSPSTTPVQNGRPVSPNIKIPNSTPRGPPNAGIPFPTSNSYPNRTGSAPPLNINNGNNGPYPNGNYRPGPQISGPVGPPIARPSPPPHSVSEPNFNNNNSNPNGGGSTINRNNTIYRQEFVPPAERGIDTKSGGAAGMAGVGRRGFAAAARAAMFVNQQNPGGMQGPGGMPLMNSTGGRPMGPQPMQGRGMGMGPGGPPGPPGGYRPMPPPNMAPRLLDTDSIPRSTNATPPLSAGSGYSSHSPGPPVSPVSVGTAPFPTSNTITSLKSGGIPPNPNQPPMAPLPPPPAGASGTTNLGRTTTSVSSASSYASSSALSRSQSGASYAKPLAALTREKSLDRDRPPVSPIESESEYGGLAYADSTDNEDDEEHEKRTRMTSRSRSRSGSRSASLARNRFRESSPPPITSQPAPPPSSTMASSSGKPVDLPAMLRKMSTSSSGSKSGIQFGSVSVRTRSRSRSKDRGFGGSVASGSSLNGARPTHSRDTSASSTYSSVDGDGGLKNRVRERTNSSAAIAQALGLSQTPPSEYARLGGPGVGSTERSRSLKRDGVLGSVSGSMRRVRDGTGNGSVSGSIRRDRDGEYEKAEGARLASLESVKRDQEDEERRGRMRNINVDIRAANAIGESGMTTGGAKTQRSNTVQGLQSPDAAQKPIKLPTRSLTSPQLDRDKLLGGGGASSNGGPGSAAGGSRAGSDASAVAGTGGRKTTRRPKTCLKCSKTIENGRWISVDSGGVLCESCWKNMYLPKCRRCNLAIEKQAVSSSDGQLKGKYHKECFNCHICHKPFPDQSFYVYDGRPLCAYHYHEANDSLCAAARCGQPIEGPCAVSHTGDRYHPEHMTCEHPGREPCRVRLDEYWEVDGRMLCERHAAAAGRSGGTSGSGSEDGRGGQGGGEDEWERRRDLRAMKRVTRFIDLAGADGLGAGAGAGSGAGLRESGSGLR